jgi:hypothetical protein
VPAPLEPLRADVELLRVLDDLRARFGQLASWGKR